MDIKNKVAIVTGGTGGIGFATVQALLREGAKHVMFLDVESSKSHIDTCLQKLDSEFGKGRTTFRFHDITNKKEFAVIFDDVLKTQRSVDILVNNAGIFNDAEGDRMIDINLKGVVNCSLTAIERMGKHNNGKGGTIVNVASIVGLATFAAMPIYIATKHGVYAFTKSLKDHYQYTGVRALTLCPGATETNLLRSNWRERSLKFVQEKFFDELLHSSNLVQPPENVAAAIVKMIREAEPGSVWVSDDNEPPYAVQDPPLYKNRNIPV